MHYWPNLSITKALDSIGSFKGNRPKGITDDAWQSMIAEFRLNKQIALDKVPKASKKEFAPKDK